MKSIKTLATVVALTASMGAMADKAMVHTNSGQFGSNIYVNVSDARGFAKMFPQFNVQRTGTFNQNGIKSGGTRFARMAFAVDMTKEEARAHLESLVAQFEGK